MKATLRHKAKRNTAIVLPVMSVTMIDLVSSDWKCPTPEFFPFILVIHRPTVGK